MEKYRRNRSVADKQLGSLPARRFTHECAWACHLGTDDAKEFAQHIGECRFILPAVRERVALALSRGEVVCIDPERPPGDREGQLEIPGMPKSVPRHKVSAAQ